MAISSFEILFLGICTHMKDTIAQEYDIPSPAWGHRVVLVDASNPDTIWNSWHLHDRAISPHFARMAVFVDDLVTIENVNTAGLTFDKFAGDPPNAAAYWNLNQVLVSVANAVPGPVDNLASGIPSLRLQANNELSAPDLQMTLHAVPTRAAAYFDFFSGALTCVRTHKASSTVMRVETLGNPQIRIHPFEAQGVFNPQQAPPIAFELRDGARITVMNLPPAEKDDADVDFYLHYLTASRFPSNVITPPDSSCPELPPGLFPPADLPVDRDGYFLITAGCSNSNFP